MMFSPPDLKSEKWFPEIPILTAGENFDEDYKALSVKLQQLATVNGLPDLKSYLSISADVHKLTITESEGKSVFIVWGHTVSNLYLL